MWSESVARMAASEGYISPLCRTRVVITVPGLNKHRESRISFCNSLVLCNSSLHCLSIVVPFYIICLLFNFSLLIFDILLGIADYSRPVAAVQNRKAT